MNVRALTLKSCKNKTTEITIDMDDILFIERLPGGNARLHFSGHEAITVHDPYETVRAMKQPPEPMSVSMSVAEWNQAINDRRLGADRRTEALETIPVDEHPENKPSGGHHSRRDHKKSEK